MMRPRFIYRQRPALRPVFSPALQLFVVKCPPTLAATDLSPSLQSLALEPSLAASNLLPTVAAATITPVIATIDLSPNLFAEDCP